MRRPWREDKKFARSPRTSAIGEEQKKIECREPLADAGAAAFLSALGEAFAANGGLSMRPSSYKVLQTDFGHCVAIADDCLRPCIGMVAMKDYLITGCINTACQVVGPAARFRRSPPSIRPRFRLSSRRQRKSATPARRNAKNIPISPNARPAPCTVDARWPFPSEGALCRGERPLRWLLENRRALRRRIALQNHRRRGRVSRRMA